MDNCIQKITLQRYVHFHCDHFVLPKLSHYIFKLLDSCYQTWQITESQNINFRVRFSLHDAFQFLKNLVVWPVDKSRNSKYIIASKNLLHISKYYFYTVIRFIIHKLSDSISPSYQSIFQLSLEVLVCYRCSIDI